MSPVLWAALGIGGSTLIGTACGFLFNRVTPLWNDLVTALAAGIMLAAATFGLFVPAMEMACGPWNWTMIPVGALCGTALLRAVGFSSQRLGGSTKLFHHHPELLFVLAIAVHKFPEGMAGGIGLNGANATAAWMVVGGIALQNFPEGVVMIPPLLNAGVRRKQAACIALATGVLNAAGVFAGALWGHLAQGLLPFTLAFAGGAMLDVIITNMIPRAINAQQLRQGGFIVMCGFLFMTCVNSIFQ